MIRKAFAMSLAATFGVAVAAQPALAAGKFNETTQAIWIARTDRMIAAATAANGETSDTIAASIKATCDGITMEVAKPNIPDWAQRSHLYYCHSVDGLTNPFMAKSMCKEMKISLSALGKMDATKESEEVVDAARRLQTTELLMMDIFKAKRYC